jgi:hypothetical protein
MCKQRWSPKPENSPMRCGYNTTRYSLKGLVKNTTFNPTGDATDILVCFTRTKKLAAQIPVCISSIGAENPIAHTQVS